MVLLYSKCLYSSRPLMTLFDRDDSGCIAARSRWLRSVSDDTTGRQRGISCSHPCRGASSFYSHLITGRCRFAQPPATCFDASGTILIRCILCGRIIASFLFIFNIARLFLAKFLQWCLLSDDEFIDVIT